MELLFIKCKEDGQISPEEFDLFQKLLKEYENGPSIKKGLKSKDIKKAEKRTKKEIHQQQTNVLYNNVLQEQLKKLN